MIASRVLRLGLAATLAAVLFGCAGVERLGYDSDQRCGRDAARLLAGIDWSQARTAEVSVSSGEFTPMTLELSRNRPYRLKITNRDAVTRVFNAGRFFHSAALASVEDGATMVEARCIQLITIAPGATVEARLMPLRRGRYEVSESYLPLGYWGTGLGVVSVN